MVNKVQENQLYSEVTVRQINRASIDLKVGRSSARLEVQKTPAGLVAVGCLVSSILLSVAPIVTAATRHLRR